MIKFMGKLVIVLGLSVIISYVLLLSLNAIVR